MLMGYPVSSFHGQIVPSHIVSQESQIVPQKSQIVPLRNGQIKNISIVHRSLHECYSSVSSVAHMNDQKDQTVHMIDSKYPCINFILQT